MINHIKKTAIKMIEENGLINLRRSDLCKRAGISAGSFHHIMGVTFMNFVVDLKDQGYKQVAKDVTRRRANPTLRKEHILGVAISLATINGYQNLTRQLIASNTNVSVSLVSKYFPSIDELKNEVIMFAIKNKIIEIIAQSIFNRHPLSFDISKELKKQAIDLISEY